MEAEDGSFSFDFAEVYEEIVPNENLVYSIADGHKANITYCSDGDAMMVTEKFEAEKQNAIALQQQGWQANLVDFKRNAEENK